jgi:hypothetical protein
MCVVRGFQRKENERKNGGNRGGVLRADGGRHLFSVATGDARHYYSAIVQVTVALPQIPHAIESRVEVVTAQERLFAGVVQVTHRTSSTAFPSPVLIGHFRFNSAWELYTVVLVTDHSCQSGPAEKTGFVDLTDLTDTDLRLVSDWTRTLRRNRVDRKGSAERCFEIDMSE